MSKRLLITTQLSNINYKHNKFDLSCDSGYQMVMGRVREMLKLNPELYIDVMVPSHRSLIEQPQQINPDLAVNEHLRFPRINVELNALAARYDFDWEMFSWSLDLDLHKDRPELRYDAVYVNDPMQLRALKALFHVRAGYQPKFFVHSHFVDVPEVPKFPQEASLWLGQCEAAIKADWNFWQCESAMLQFFDSMGKWFTQNVVDGVRAKSSPWDDGFSRSEITQPVDMSKLRFTPQEWQAKTAGKVVLFFPNRISPSSGDYTSGMKWMFELLPQLRQRRQDFVVVCGNPNQKFTNAELEEKCGNHGYVSLTPDTFNRDEYRFVASHSDIVLNLYLADAYGATSARECVELGCCPIWPDVHEYSRLMREAGRSYGLFRPDFSDFIDTVDNMVTDVSKNRNLQLSRLNEVIRQRCSYEATTPVAMQLMGLL